MLALKRREILRFLQWFYVSQAILYRDKFVAVWNQKVIEADDDLELLSKNVRFKTKGAKGVYFAYASDKPVEMIL